MGAKVAYFNIKIKKNVDYAQASIPVKTFNA